MGLFNLFKKRNQFNSYVLEKKHLSTLSLAAFTHVFSEYDEFVTSEQNMKIWDALFPIAMCGYSSIIDNVTENSIEFNSLKKSISEQFYQGEELLNDYDEFIKSRRGSKDLSQHTAFWFSKNMQLYLPENLKLKVGEIKFLNIISLFLRLSFNENEHNFSNYLATTFTSDLKTKSGMSEYAMLIEIYCKNIFNMIKERV